ncbi:MAG: translocation/assembly module TamB domain-containing protein [Treponema sp.]|uniref:translocation/assembly module TamB domain-containing protein n=1 Tax=Treponema sp. TaxID=166 RepID=UPI0025D5B246|nr:translocation/assembly module TamB domain-containing protein [Treponema sp.]MBQ9282115.1 translocation/assembly module TamB domain-containing protein [Treponema sp.]
MKSKVFGVSLGSSIFILLLVAVLALVRPVYLRIEGSLSLLEKSLSEKLESELGLSLSYSSLSPSIFIGVNLRNVSIYESATQTKLVGIKRASLSYNIASFFSKNPTVALKELTLNGVTVEYNAMNSSQFIEKLRKLLKKDSAETASSEDGKDRSLPLSQDAGISPSSRDFDIPIDVVIKNLSVHYADSQNDVLASLKKIKFKDFWLSDGIEIETEGKLFYKTALFKTGGRWTSLSCNFSVSGTLFENLEGSSALVSLSGASGADYSLSNLDMLVNYAGDTVEIRTMRTVLPFSIFARYDFKDSSLVFSGEFDRFNPFSLVSMRHKNPTLQKVNGSTVSGSLFGKISSSEVNYNADISFALPKKLVGDAITLSVRCEGDEKSVGIEKLSAKGNFIDTLYSGSFDFKTLQPSGVLTLNNFTLKNGGVISTEVYVDPYRNGFMCVAPQIFLGEKSFTGVQLTVLPGNNSADFQFELLDFAHPDYEETGRLQINGSFLMEKEKVVQTSIVFSNVFADSIIDTAAFFMPKEKQEMLSSLSEKLSPYIFATEMYFYSDFKDFSINAENGLFANTEKDREILTFAIDGSKEVLQLSRLDVLFGNQTAHAETAIEFAESFSEFSFTTDLSVNSVPYHFFGNFSPEWISVSGDYDFDAIVSIDDEVGATVQFSQFPFGVGKYVFALSSSAILHWSHSGGFDADIISFEIDEPSSYLQFGPHLSLSGSLNRYGLVLSSLAYSDTVSALEGDGTIVWNINDSILDSIHASLSAASSLTTEKFYLNADLSNPSQLPFSSDALKNDFYISAEAEIRSFPSARLLSLQNPENTVSADVTASGTLSNPFLSVQLHRSSLLLYGYPLAASASLVLDDTGMHLDDLNCDWSFLKVSDASAFFDPNSFTGNASLVLDGVLMDKTIHAPVSLDIEGSSPERKFGVPDYYSFTLSSKKVSGDFIASDFPFKITAVHSPNRFDIMTDVSNGFQASFTTDDGMISASAGKASPIQFNLNGSIKQNNLDLNISGIQADMRFICSEIEIPFVSFNSGILSGALKITGPTTDPEYTGAFSVMHPNFIIPLVSKDYFHTDKVIMTVGQGEALVPPTPVTLGRGMGTVQYRMEFNRWIPNFLELNIDIDDNAKVPLDLTFPFIHAKGRASGNLTLAFTLPRDVSISGFVTADDTDVEIVATPLQTQFSIENLSNFFPSSQAAQQGDLNVTVDFDIIVGQKVQLLFNPFLRGVVAPGTPLSIYLDSYTGDFEFKSDITLRGGEITWLNRNFYMKEGRIVFNETQDSIDPKVTVRAETRERDENGNMVTITLSANNQPVSTFNPTFTATPAKSEREIMNLLGQVISADSSGAGEFGGAFGDLFLQSTVMRRVENTLRELLNFDIVSIRTNVVQNSLKLSMDESTNNKQLSVGNFMDNSTVYVGKYFGSSIYLDSMLHWTYDEHKIDNGSSVNGLVFQPEIGFEMASPFANIRLQVAPDIDSLQKGLLNTWVPSTSMTLSWKFAF